MGSLAGSGSEEEHTDTLQVEVTNRCNLECVMCMRRNWNAKLVDLDFDLYRKIAKSSFSKLSRLTLYGFGEPFTNPDLLAMLRLSKDHLQKESEVMLSTNGSILFPKLSDKLLRGELVDELSFSIDTTDIDRLSQIRKGSRLKEIIRNLEYLTRACTRLGRGLRVGAEVVIFRDNVKELPDLVTDLAEKNVEHILVSNVVPYTREMFERIVYTTMSKPSLQMIQSLAERDLLLRNDAVHEMMAEILGMRAQPKTIQAHTRIWDEASKRGYSLNLPLLSKSQESLRQAHEVEKYFHISKQVACECGLELSLPAVIPDAKRRSCPYVEKKASFVRSDGKVAPCMDFAYTHELFVNMHVKRIHEVIIGDLRRESLEEVWNKKNYSEFRNIRKQMSGNIPWCGDCPFSSSGCYHTETNDQDCYANEPGCSECLYSIGLSRCNI